MLTIHLIIGLLFTMPISSTAALNIQTSRQAYETVEEVPKKEVGLILGAAAYPNGLSDILEDRMDTGIELYQSKKVEKLIMTGAPNEAEGMKKYAIEKGVRAQDIIEDPKGLNTLASIKNLSKLGKSATIITQKYHLPRALFIANTMGIKVDGIEAKSREYTKMFEFKKRELLATSKAIFDIYWAK